MRLSRLSERKPEIEAELRENILPWWMAHMVDMENGGFYGAVTNDLRVFNDAPRAVVLCARILWTYAAAYRAYQTPSYLKMARHAYETLTTRFWDEQYGGFYWLIDREGAPISDRKQTYGQGFAIYGLSEYYLATGEEDSLKLAQQTFRLVEQHAFDPQYGGYLEARARDWSEQGDLRLSDKEPNCVKTMNTMLHIIEPYTNLLRAWDDPKLRVQLTRLVKDFLEHVVDPKTHATRLFFDADWRSEGGLMSFGHDIEASWLLVEAAEELRDAPLIARARQNALEMAEAVAQRGLDDDGSLFYEGEGGQITLDEKHWWPQAEGMVGFYNAAQIAQAAGDTERAEGYAGYASRLWQYIQEKLVDRQHGDWFKRLNRAGEPMADSYKADAWDCPYHHARACCEMLRRI